jgi:ABC-type Mn2+/Zn2+ transport system permease subunit
MNALIAPFASNQFMLNALVAGILVSVACGIIGTYMVLRGLAFIGDALAHGVLPGIAAALLLGLPGIIGAAAGSLAMIGGIALITRKSDLSSDTAIGLSFVGMLALGVVIVSRSSSFSGDLVKVLFGEILGITSSDILVQLFATIALGIFAFLWRRPFILLCFNQEQAQVSGFNAKLYHAIMLLMIALTVVVSFQTVGTLLVFGMLLAPAATSALFSRRIQAMMFFAMLIGSFSVFTGLLLSYHFNFAAGASITLVATIIFFLSLVGTRIFGSLAASRHTDRLHPAAEVKKEHDHG